MNFKRALVKGCELAPEDSQRDLGSWWPLPHPLSVPPDPRSPPPPPFDFPPVSSADSLPSSSHHIPAMTLVLQLLPLLLLSRALGDPGGKPSQ